MIYYDFFNNLLISISLIIVIFFGSIIKLFSNLLPKYKSSLKTFKYSRFSFISSSLYIFSFPVLTFFPVSFVHSFLPSLSAFPSPLFPFFSFALPSFVVVQSLNCVQLFEPMECSPPGSFTHGIFQARYWSGLPFPSPGNMPDPGIELFLLHWQTDFYH